MRLRRLEPFLRRALRGLGTTPRGGRVLVAVSGGADSTALLIGLHRVAHELGLVLHAAHLHHGLRGAEADADLEFVRDLCARIGVPLSYARWNTKLRMRRRGLSGQAGLRTLRREFLRRTARRLGAARIATAHTADDQLETLLLRLMRGTGLPGLGGMSARRGAWIKPLLEATRAEIEADLRDAHQTWREDSTNLDPAYARNRVRHLVVPALIKALDPRIDPVRARSGLARRVALAAREIRAARRTLEARASRLLRHHSRIQGAELLLDSRELQSCPLSLRYTLMRQAWRRVRPAGPGLTHRHLWALNRLSAASRGGARIELPSNWTAERDLESIRIRPAGDATGPRTFQFKVPGRVSSSRYTVRGTWTSGAGAIGRLPAKSASEEYFAADGLEGKLELRAAQADEPFVPFGRRRPRRVGEFLSKQRVSRELRSRPTVLADAGGILWVIGVRRSARAPVTAGTRRVLWVQAESHD